MILQYGFGKTADEIKTMTRRAMSSVDKLVVAGEYGNSDEAVNVKLGDAAASAGAKGFGDGGTPGR
jgi:hypothetical protein